MFHLSYAKEFSQLAPKMTQLEPFLCQHGNFSEISNLSKLQFSPVLVVILKIVPEAQHRYIFFKLSVFGPFELS